MPILRAVRLSAGVLWLLLAVALPAQGQQERRTKLFQQLHGEGPATTGDRADEERKAWSSFQEVDVRQPRPAAFRYLIHVVANTAEKKFSLESRQTYELMRDPARLHETPVLSASLVSDERRTIYFAGHFPHPRGDVPIGVILKVPPENLVAMCTQDMKSNLMRGEAVRGGDERQGSFRRMYEIHGMESPESLLARTFSAVFNEVLLAGTSEAGTRIEVAAYFIGPPLKENPDLTEVEKVRELGQRFGLPVVELPVVPIEPQEMLRVLSSTVTSGRCPHRPD